MSTKTQSTRRQSSFRSRKRKPILGLLPQFVLIAVIISVLLTVSGAVVAKIAQPLVLMHQQSVQIRQVQSQLSAVQSENSRLEKERAFLSQPAGIEVAARQGGFIRKGEDPIVVEMVPAPQPAPSSNHGILDKLHSAWLTFSGR